MSNFYFLFILDVYLTLERFKFYRIKEIKSLENEIKRIINLIKKKKKLDT